MNSRNRSEIIGFVGQDAELQTTTTGRTFCRTSIATTDRWRDKDGVRQERTEWHSVVFWGELAKAASEYVRKGRLVLVAGPNRSREYDDRDGVHRRVWEIAAHEFLLLDRAERRAENDASGEHSAA